MYFFFLSVQKRFHVGICTYIVHIPTTYIFLQHFITLRFVFQTKKEVEKKLKNKTFISHFFIFSTMQITEDLIISKSISLAQEVFQIIENLVEDLKKKEDK